MRRVNRQGEWSRSSPSHLRFERSAGLGRLCHSLVQPRTHWKTWSRQVQLPEYLPNSRIGNNNWELTTRWKDAYQTGRSILPYIVGVHEEYETSHFDREIYERRLNQRYTRHHWRYEWVREITNARNRGYRGEIAKSSFSGSGSDQTRSAMGPSCGISGWNVSM